MIRTNKVKAMLEKSQVAIGVMLITPDPTLVELIGLCGFDYVIFDGEHGSLTPDRLEHAVRACDSVGLTPIARLTFDKPESMLPWVETGILGVMQPHTRSAHHASMLVNGLKYSPIGDRGLGVGRAGMYGTLDARDHLSEWNRELLAIAQLEDSDALNNVDEILAVDGLDACYIGATDLAHAIGYTGQPSHAAVRQTQAQLADRVSDAGKWVGFGARHPYSADEAARLRGMGANLFSFNFVGLFLRTGIELLEASRALLERA